MAKDVKLASNLASCIRYFHVNYPGDDRTTSVKQRGRGRLLSIHDVTELSQSQETEVLTLVISHGHLLGSTHCPDPSLLHAQSWSEQRI